MRTEQKTPSMLLDENAHKWKLVPMIPTHQMIIKGAVASGLHDGEPAFVYEAMLSVSPKKEKPDTKAVRQILCNELGLTKESVREIIGEKVNEYLKAMSPDAETIICRVTNRVVSEQIRSAMRQNGRYYETLESIIRKETERHLEPIIKKIIAQFIPVKEETYFQG